MPNPSDLGSMLNDAAGYASNIQSAPSDMIAPTRPTSPIASDPMVGTAGAGSEPSLSSVGPQIELRPGVTANVASDGFEKGCIKNPGCKPAGNGGCSLQSGCRPQRTYDKDADKANDDMAKEILSQEQNVPKAEQQMSESDIFNELIEGARSTKEQVSYNEIAEKAFNPADQMIPQNAPPPNLLNVGQGYNETPSASFILNSLMDRERP